MSWSLVLVEVLTEYSVNSPTAWTDDARAGLHSCTDSVNSSLIQTWRLAWSADAIQRVDTSPKARSPAVDACAAERHAPYLQISVSQDVDSLHPKTDAKPHLTLLAEKVGVSRTHVFIWISVSTIFGASGSTLQPATPLGAPPPPPTQKKKKKIIKKKTKTNNNY